MKSALLSAAAIIAGVIAVPRAAADLLFFHVYRVTVSMTCVSLEDNGQGSMALVTRKLTNKQIINLAQGRAPEALVPKNERLVALAPDDYLNLAEVRVALLDANTASIIKVIGTTSSSEVAYGPPDGNAAQGVGTGTLIALISPTFALSSAPLSVSFKGVEKPNPRGPVQSLRMVSVSAPVTLTVNGADNPAIFIGGSIRVAGKPLLDLYVEL